MLILTVGDDLLVPGIGEMQLVEPEGRAVRRATGRWVLASGKFQADQSAAGTSEELLHSCGPLRAGRGRNCAEELRVSQHCATGRVPGHQVEAKATNS